MPQLEISTYLTQIFWTILTFISFWLIMDKLIVPKIAETIEARKRKYDDFIIKAEEINAKALASLKNYEEALTAAKANAAVQIKKTEEELKTFISDKEEEINKRLRTQISEQEARLAEEKAATMQKVEEMSESLVYTILEQLEIKSIKSPAALKNAYKKEKK